MKIEEFNKLPNGTVLIFESLISSELSVEVKNGDLLFCVNCINNKNVGNVYTKRMIATGFSFGNYEIAPKEIQKMFKIRD